MIRIANISVPGSCYDTLHYTMAMLISYYVIIKIACITWSCEAHRHRQTQTDTDMNECMYTHVCTYTYTHTYTRYICTYACKHQCFKEKQILSNYIYTVYSIYPKCLYVTCFAKTRHVCTQWHRMVFLTNHQSTSYPYNYQNITTKR